MRHTKIWAPFLALIAILCLLPDIASAADHASLSHHIGDLLAVGGPGAMAFALIGNTTGTSVALRAAQQEKTRVVAEWRAKLDAITSAGREPTAEEQADLDKYQARIDALNKRISSEQALIEAEKAIGIEVSAESRISGGEPALLQDPKRGFASLGEFAKSVRLHQTGARFDERIRTIEAAAPSTYSNEASGADGGFLVPPEFSREVWRLSLGEQSLIPLTANVEIQGNSLWLPKDETTPWGGSGVQAYWRAEGPAMTASKLSLSAAEMRLHELIVLVPITGELLDDAPGLGSYMLPMAAERITWKANEAILFGDGVGKPLGAMNSKNGALIVVSAESGQTSGTFVNQNVSKMVSRLVAGQLMNAVWIGNPDVLPALENMTAGQYPIYLPGNNVAGASYGTLKGRPLLLSEHANALGSQGDLSLLSLKGYRTITKASGIETATSMHLYFDANAMAYRWIFRIDGKPVISAPVSPPAGKSSNTRSYFVTMGSH